MENNHRTFDKTWCEHDKADGIFRFFFIFCWHFFPGGSIPMRSTQHLWCDIEPNKLHINHWSVTWDKQTNKRMLNEWTHWNKSMQNKRRTHRQWDVDILDTVWLITITRHYKWENKSNENAMWSQKNALHTFMFPQVKCAWHACDRLFYFHLVLALCASLDFFLVFYFLKAALISFWSLLHYYCHR